MLMTPPDGGYWLQNGEHESARDEDGIWRAPEIDTEHFTIEMDTVANVYRKYFKGQVSRYSICKLLPFICVSNYSTAVKVFILTKDHY